jgi:hypothetical protein
MGEFLKISKEKRKDYIIQNMGKAFGYGDIDTSTKGFAASLGGKEKATQMLQMLYESDDVDTTMKNLGIQEGSARYQVGVQLEKYSQNQEKYKKDDALFQEKLKKVREVFPDDTDAQLIEHYITRYNIKDPSLLTDAIYNDMHLPTDNMLYWDMYKEGTHFKTGLTNVPYNNYPALLHEGERVLTAEEAEAYNEMSSYAVSNMVNQNKTYGNSSNNVFNTNTYGPTDFERSINNQTNSLNSTLNQILGVLRSIMNSSSYSGQTAGFRNAIKGNSNLAQLNTV